MYLNNFRKKWLDNLNVNAFVESETLKDNGFSPGIVLEKSEYITLQFYHNRQKAILKYSRENGTFVTVTHGSDDITFPQMSEDQIIVASDIRIKEFVEKKFYEDSNKILNDINELFDIHFNVEHPNPYVTDKKRIRVLHSLRKLKNDIME